MALPAGMVGIQTWLPRIGSQPCLDAGHADRQLPTMPSRCVGAVATQHALACAKRCGLTPVPRCSLLFCCCCAPLTPKNTPKTHIAHPQERLAQQKAEKAAKGEQYNAEYKPQRTKDEAKERRKAILSNIGEVGGRCL